MSPRIEVHPFSLQYSLECGQFFRFTKGLEGTYIVQASNRIFSVWQRGRTLFYEGVDESFLIHFFRLDEDLRPILRAIDQDPVIHEAIKTYPGLRLLRQDPWECLISYLCSTAKSIPHIRSIVEGLCRLSGKKIQFGNYISYQFPEALCPESFRLLESIGAGFRVPYLVDAGRCVNRETLIRLKGLPYAEARKELMTLAGVGKKVADCVLLYSLDFLEAFPMDTWIRKGLERYYFSGKSVGEKMMEEFVSHRFGPLAGYAQLYLFHYWRYHPIRP